MTAQPKHRTSDVGLPPRRRELNAFFRETAFAARIDAARSRGLARYEPWPALVGEPGLPYTTDPLIRLLHAGEQTGLDATAYHWAVPALRSADLVAGDGPLRPGRWEVTAFQGVIAVRDRRRTRTRGRLSRGGRFTAGRGDPATPADRGGTRGGLWLRNRVRGTGREL